MDVISLTRKLLSFNTINPPGNESEIALFLGDLLKANGFNVSYPLFRKNRMNLIAEKGLSPRWPPIILSGHFDTVPRGKKIWSVDPFAGEVSDGRIWGRGSSDMKGGLAAMVMASIAAFREASTSGGIRIIFTAAEEPGCLGVSKLAGDNTLPGGASAIIVGEPTACLPATAHKGAIYLKAVTSGKTAHSSMPELGINAIYKAAEAITKIRDFEFEAEKDPLLGYPTINVGRIKGGKNINSVPDHAEFTIDVRTTTRVDHKDILERLNEELGDDIWIKNLVDLKPVFTPSTDPFVRLVYDVCGVSGTTAGFPKALSYMTDGAVLQEYYGGVPVVILGPGQPEMAHQTDEYCEISKLERSVELYKSIILRQGE